MGQEPRENEGSDELDADPLFRLDHFLQACGVQSGGQAKLLIQGGEILVNGKVETRRRKKLRAGDEVTWDGEIYIVSLNDGAETELGSE
jgi:ribosome-associated protein